MVVKMMTKFFLNLFCCNLLILLGVVSGQVIVGEHGNVDQSEDDNDMKETVLFQGEVNGKLNYSKVLQTDIEGHHYHHHLHDYEESGEVFAVVPTTAAPTTAAPTTAVPTTVAPNTVAPTTAAPTTAALTTAAPTTVAPTTAAPTTTAPTTAAPTTAALITAAPTTVAPTTAAPTTAAPTTAAPTTAALTTAAPTTVAPTTLDPTTDAPTMAAPTTAAPTTAAPKTIPPITTASKSLSWVPLTSWNIPADSILAGYEMLLGTNYSIYIGRTSRDGIWYPTKILPGLYSGWYPYQLTKEVPVSNNGIEILVANPYQRIMWVPGTPGVAPVGAITTGTSTYNGKAAYIGRGFTGPTLTPGWIITADNTCYIPWNGINPVSSYEYLVIEP